MEGANFRSTTSNGFTASQLYSTASYKAKNLTGITLGGNDLTEWDFSGQNLTSSVFSSAILVNANFANANLTNSRLQASNLTGANITNAVINMTSFSDTTSKGFTATQLYSTANYNDKNLSGIDLGVNNLSDWDFSGQNLTGAFFSSSTLTNTNFGEANLSKATLSSSVLTGANLLDALVIGASFHGTVRRGFTASQLYSTASFKEKDLSEIVLSNNDLTGWDFSEQNLTGASLSSATLENVDFSNANLTNTSFTHSTLTGTDFSDATVNGASFGSTTSRGFTALQLYSTASYKNKELRGIILDSNNLSGWDFSGQNLAGAYFYLSTQTGTDFSFADLRGSSWEPDATTVTRNAIRPNGEIRGLELATGEVLVIRNLDLGITVTQGMAVGEDATLRFVLDGDVWGSTVFIADGVVPELSGVLELVFAEGVGTAALAGTTFRLFDWNSQLLPGQAFDDIITLPGIVWDTTNLYTTGEITLIPEPATLLLMALGGLALRRKQGR